MCQPFVSYPHWAKPNAPVTLALSVPEAKNITISQKSKTTKEDNWCGPSTLNRSLYAESDLQYSLNLAETRRFKATVFFFLTYGVITFITFHFVHASAWISNQLISFWVNFSTQQTRWDLVWQCFPGNPFSEFWFAGLYIPRDWDPNWTVKVQPYSLQKSFTDHRRREWSCFSPKKGVIITFPISVSMAFLNVQQTFTAGQPGICHQSKLLEGATFFSQWYWAEKKIFKRSALRGLAACSCVPFSRGSLRLAIHGEPGSRLEKTPK